MSIDDADVIARLETENAQLRRMVDDERRHVAALRETVRELQQEVVRLQGGAPQGEVHPSAWRRDFPPAH